MQKKNKAEDEEDQAGRRKQKKEKEEICAPKLNSSLYLPHSVPPAKWSFTPVLLFANSFLLL